MGPIAVRKRGEEREEECELRRRKVNLNKVMRGREGRLMDEYMHSCLLVTVKEHFSVRYFFPTYENDQLLYVIEDET